MTKRERIKNILMGKKVDKIPFSMWAHLPHADLDPDFLAKETFKFYKTYDIDFIKTMNNGMYAVEDFGCTIDFSEIEKGGIAKIISTPVTNYEDWKKIGILSGNKGALLRELKSLQKLKKLITDASEDVPLILTVFSPLTTAAKLSKDKIFEHIKEGNKEFVHKALENIANTTINFINKAKNIGIDGIFFACQISNYDKVDEELYKEFGVKYDLQVLNSVNDLWFNAIHAHGDDIMYNLLKDYPVQVFNWHAWESLPEIDYVYNTNDKTILSGLIRFDITNKNKNKVSNQIYKTLLATKGKKIIISPGCVIRYPLDEAMLNFVRTEKEYLEKILKEKNII